VKNESEAIALASDSDFGLGGSVWTKDEARGQRVASQVETGMMFVNTSPGRTRSCRSAASSTPATGANSRHGHPGVREQKLVRFGKIESPS